MISWSPTTKCQINIKSFILTQKKKVKEKLQQISVNKENSLLENPDSAKRLYQAFIADFLATQSEFPSLESLSHELIKKNISQSGEVKRKQSDLSVEWAKLLDLKKYWDNSIKAIQCIDQFNTMCADANDLLNEKLQALESDDVCDVSDVKSVRALQGKQDKLERDVGPLETNVNDLKKIADQVCKYFPQEKKNVLLKLEAIDEQWHKLRQDVKNRKAKLDEKHGLQRFENEVHDFHVACADLSANLTELDSPRDLKQCEEMLQKFNELAQVFQNDIIYKFNDLRQLSQQQMAKRGVIGSVEKINSSLNQVIIFKNSNNNIFFWNILQSSFKCSQIIEKLPNLAVKSAGLFLSNWRLKAWFLVKILPVKNS